MITFLNYSVHVCVCVYASRHLCLGDELCDLLAGVERGHLHVSHTPVGPARSIQDLVMLLQDFTETSEVQVLWTATRRQRLHTKQIGGFIYKKKKNAAGNMRCQNTHLFIC